MYRYFTHKDNPEKYQYNEEDIETINGFNIIDFVELSRGEVLQIKWKLQTLIRKYNYTEYSQLLDYLQDNNLLNEYDVATSHTLMLNGYLKSRKYYQAETKGKVKPDKIVTEILNELN